MSNTLKYNFSSPISKTQTPVCKDTQVSPLQPFVLVNELNGKKLLVTAYDMAALQASMAALVRPCWPGLYCKII